jgi:uncharacterized protein (DUF697 family)
MLRLPLSPGAVRKLLREIDLSGSEDHVLAVGGAGGLAPVLRQQFLRGHADRGAVRLGGFEGADAYVHVLDGIAADEDTALLRQARRAGVPTIAVVVGLPRETAVPYVPATDVVRVPAGVPLPLETIARAIAARLEEDGAPLAAPVPVLREAVCDRLVTSFARKNGMLAAATWIPGADLPVLALNQLRLVLRLAQAHGVRDARELMPELAATFGAGLGLRALAREILELVPGARWAVKAAVAYAGTRALGETARLRFGSASMPRRAAASRGVL